MLSRWLAAFAVFTIPAVAEAQPPANWSGFYVGADLGLAGGRLHARGTDTIYQLTNIDPPGPAQPLTVVPITSVSYNGSDRQSGFVYGATAGFLVGAGNWLFGLEADGHGSRAAGSILVTAPKPATVLEPAGTVTVGRAARISWDWAARGRIGYNLGPSMIYAAGGVTSARLRLRGSDTYLIPTGTSPGSGAFAPPTIGPIAITQHLQGTMIGWTAGIGGEHFLSRHLSLGLDGRYSDYGNRTYDFTDCIANFAIAGRCRNTSFSGPSTLTFPSGTNPATISANSDVPYPGAAPGPTRVSLTEWRLAARLIFRF